MRMSIPVASFLGCDAADVVIRDLAVHPVTHNVFLSIQRGKGDAGQAVLVRINRLDGAVSDVALRDLPMAETTIADAPAEDDERTDIILPLGEEGEEADGRDVDDPPSAAARSGPRRSPTWPTWAVNFWWLGSSNEEFSSKLRRIPFPFSDEGTANNLEILHVSHGKWETAAPIRAFVSYEEGRSILATYTCTPVVHFGLADLEPGSKTVGRTVAELGAMNQPLDMVSFTQGGEEHLLVANSSHGLIKIDCTDIDGQEGLTQPRDPVGVPREKKDLEGIVRLANLNGSHVLALQVDESGASHLRSLKTASL